MADSLDTISTAAQPREISSGIELDETLAAAATFAISDIDTSQAGSISVQASITTATAATVAVYASNGTLDYTTSPIGVMNLSTAIPNEIMYVITNCDLVKIVVTNTSSTAGTTSVGYKVLGN